MAGPDSFDGEVRQAAFSLLAEQTRLHGEVLPASATAAGVVVRGERVALMTPYRGIFKPRQLTAALSILTAPPKARGDAPYDDRMGADGLLEYHYRGTDPGHRDNRAVRAALRERLPLVYFYGITPGHYLPVWPVHVVGERGTYFQVDLTGMAALPELGVAAEDPERSYRTGVVRHRLHQARFREAVLRAYRRTCSVCRLRRAELVDAAHIVGDAEGGLPVIRNGLALCKLHHAAFDRHILGVRPDLRVVVRRDVLEEHDGPMLVHGIQGFHGEQIVVPRRALERPDPTYLEARFERFRAAS